MPKEKKKRRRPRYSDLMRDILSKKGTREEELEAKRQQIRECTGGGVFRKLDTI